jgi:signal transduction histidine kinase
MLLVVVAIIVAVFVFAVVIRNYYYSTVRTGLEAKAKTATDFFSNYVAKAEAEYYDSAMRYAEAFFNDNDKIELQFVNTDGQLMISTSGFRAGMFVTTPDMPEAVRAGSIRSWTGDRAMTGERIMSVSSPMLYSGNQVIGVMRYVTSMEKVDRQVLLSVLMVLGIGLAVLLLVMGTNMIFIRSVMLPVGEIMRVSKRIADGSYGIQIEGEYVDDIGEMVKSINEMSLKIAQAERVQSEFIASVSHELRTPLTAITGWGETIAYNDQLDRNTQRGLGIILKEARRLAKMVEELLEFTRMEDGRFTLNISRVDPGAELEDAIFTYGALLGAGEDMEIEYVPYEDDLPSIPGDASRLKQVFSNLFDNAAKYGKSGRKITVAIRPEKQFIVISIRDYGDGVPPDELPHLKKKFYKGTNARGRGSGIGLAVCDEIMRYHGGRLDVANADGGGLLVTLSLPISSALHDE